MKQSKFYVVFALLLMVSMVLTACQQPTAAPKATDVPQAAFKAEKLAAPADDTSALVAKAEEYLRRYDRV